MPLREFRCDDCNSVSEILIRSASDENSVRCGGCGSANVERMLSTASVAVKSGWQKRCPSDCPSEEGCRAREAPCSASLCQR